MIFTKGFLCTRCFAQHELTSTTSRPHGHPSQQECHYAPLAPVAGRKWVERSGVPTRSPCREAEEEAGPRAGGAQPPAAPLLWSVARAACREHVLPPTRTACSHLLPEGWPSGSPKATAPFPDGEINGAGVVCWWLGRRQRTQGPGVMNQQA